MLIWIVVSIPLWVAGSFSLLLGVLVCLVGDAVRSKLRKLPLGDDMFQTVFGVVLTASGSGFFYFAAKLCGY